MSVDDQRALVRIDRERLMEALRQQMDTAWQAVLCLPEDHPRREAALNAIQEAWYTNIALAELIEQAEGIMSAAHAALEETRGQRDQIAGELQELVEAIQNFWGTDHPLLEGLYDDVMETHNQAFWESLPYDMAAALGGDWDFIDADMLYTLLTVDPEEVDEAGYGFTPEHLAEFRQNLLTALRAFTTRNEGQHGGE